MIYEKYPYWDIDVENGTVYSFKLKRFIGSLNNKGYLQTGNKINGKSNIIMLHRLIWECANGEIPKGYEIHHIDGNKLNNSISNLEMITIANHHSEHKPIKNNPQISKKVVQYSLNGEILKVWDSINECERNGFLKTPIINCCKNKPHYNTHRGFIWKYYEKEKDVA